MPVSRWIAPFALAASLTAGSMVAQNVQDTKSAKHQLKQQEKANKAQAKADKAERKALGMKQQKKADKAQDEANRKAAAVPPAQ